jgi:hypothetical protein
VSLVRVLGWDLAVPFGGFPGCPFRLGEDEVCDCDWRCGERAWQGRHGQ